MSDAEWAVVRDAMPVPAWLEGRGGQPEGYCHRQMVDAVRYLVAGPALVANGLRMAARTCGSLDRAVFHSDHGAQYGSRDFADLCTQLKVTRSMGAVGTSADNAARESFHASLQRETLQGAHDHGNATTCRKTVFAWLTRYNTRRRHSANGHLSPHEYERRRDGDAHAGRGQFVGERLEERRVCRDAEDVLWCGGDAEEAGECCGRARREVGGAVGMAVLWKPSSPYAVTPSPVTAARWKAPGSDACAGHRTSSAGPVAAGVRRRAADPLPGGGSCVSRPAEPGDRPWWPGTARRSGAGQVIDHGGGRP
ncbi:integrase core domain-containing protein [Streptomyces sp. NPDC002917]|uniref:integrase core domain-containing protein n=1 Tax=Streptomyces sp. NPDC002917 TaxID=3364671 RepID=UPI003698AE11